MLNQGIVGNRCVCDDDSIDQPFEHLHSTVSWVQVNYYDGKEFLLYVSDNLKKLS